MKTLSFRFFLLLFLLTAFLMACERRTEQAQVQTPSPASQEAAAPSGGAQPPVDVMEAMAELQPTEGSQVTGRVLFSQVPEGVRIVAEVEGLTPGLHGFHVHEFGDCSAPDASSAGNHFAPGGSPHGSPDSPADQRHAGDLGNLEAGPDGRALYERVDSILQLSGSDSLVGRAVVVHANEDDLTSQPSGNAGSRLACGVIRETPAP